MLVSLQKTAIEQYCQPYIECIRNLKWSQSLEVLRAVLSEEDLTAEQIEEFQAIPADGYGCTVDDSVGELRGLLLRHDLFTAFNLRIYAPSEANSNQLVQEHIQSLIAQQIELTQAEYRLIEVFGAIATEEELINLKISPYLRELMFSEVIASKFRVAQNFAEFQQIFNIFERAVKILPVLGSIVLLMDMDDRSIRASEKVISILKTGYNDLQCDDLFRNFPDLDTVRNLADRDIVSIQQLLLRQGYRQSPEWFIKDHPQYRDLLVSQEGEAFDNIKHVLVKAQTHSGIKRLIEEAPSKIDSFTEVNEEQLARIEYILTNIKREDFKAHPYQIKALYEIQSTALENLKLALEKEEILRFINTHPRQIEAISSLDSLKQERAAETLSNSKVKCLLNQHPHLLQEFVLMNQQQFTTIINAIADLKNLNTINMLLSALINPIKFLAIQENMNSLIGHLKTVRALYQRIDQIKSLISGIEGLDREFSAEELASYINNAKIMFVDRAHTSVMFKIMPADQLNLLVEPLKAVILEKPWYISYIPADRFDLFMESFKAAMLQYPRLVFEAMPADKFELFMESLKAAILKHPYLVLEAIPTAKFDLFVKPLEAAILQYPCSVCSVLGVISPDKFSLFKDAIEAAMLADPGYTVYIVRSIPADQFDLFVVPLTTVMLANPLYIVDIVKAIATAKWKFFVEPLTIEMPAYLKQIYHIMTSKLEFLTEEMQKVMFPSIANFVPDSTQRSIDDGTKDIQPISSITKFHIGNLAESVIISPVFRYIHKTIVDPNAHITLRSCYETQFTALVSVKTALHQISYYGLDVLSPTTSLAMKSLYAKVITDLLVKETDLSIAYSFEIVTHVAASFMSFATSAHMVYSSLYRHSPMIAGFVAGVLKDTYQTAILSMFSPNEAAVLLEQDYVDQSQGLDFSGHASLEP